MTRLTNKRILLGVTGGIAAYKSAELIRRMQDEGADVRVVMTAAAQEFITPLTLQALSGHPVATTLLDAETESVMGHIELARWADLILIAPASADFIARIAGGQGDDLLTTLCLAADGAMAIAPAMNQAMWRNPATARNVVDIRTKGFLIFGPDEGLQACGEVGPGRLLDIEGLVDAVAGVFPSQALRGRHVVITAGPTREAIDPVRFISNHSSGKQGYALAEAARDAEARVTLISGPTQLEAPDRVTRIDVISADDMYHAAIAAIDDCDIFIGVAAVADYKPVLPADQKIKKSDAPSNRSITIELIENSDIIAAVAGHPERPYTVGFAAETQDVVQYARGKLDKKNLDMIVANDVSGSDRGFNSENNQTTVLYRAGTDVREEALPLMSKGNVARRIIELIVEQTGATQTAALPEASS